MSDIRDRAKKILDQIPAGKPINSVGGTAALFTQLTGLTQEQMKADWDMRKEKHLPGALTSCNSFTGSYGGKLGSKGIPFGSFLLDQELKKNGKALAWVEAGGGLRPKYGDIFLHSDKLHMGISLDFDGDNWTTVEGGHGGPLSGFDIVERSQSTWNPSVIKGWLDLDLFFDGPVQSGPVPQWLLGWWDVTWRQQDWYYYFSRDNKVEYTRVQPPDTSRPLTNATGKGYFVAEASNVVTIRWEGTGSLEKFVKLPVIPPMNTVRMSGTWNETETSSAVQS